MNNADIENLVFSLVNQYFMGIEPVIIQTKDGPIKVVSKEQLAETACDFMTELSEVLENETD